ncbi:MAG: hypothetical protein ACTSV5_09110 [Promethearchaeota archaeon]
MKEKRLMKCPVCDNKFIPRTFYPEESIFSSPDGKKVISGFNGYVNMSGKPPEVIVGSWITYCPKCNYIMKFVKEIVRKEKIQTHGMKGTELTEKLSTYYFGFEFGDYSQYLKEIIRKVEKDIKVKMKDINIEVWENLYTLNDNFKFLVRFFNNLKDYCDKTLKVNINSDMPNKIKKLQLPKDVELSLLQLNNIKNAIVKGDYDLSREEEDMISNILLKFVFYLVDSHIKPLVSEEQLKGGFEFISMKDLKDEIRIYLATYLYSTFNSDPNSSKQIKTFLEKVF